MMIEIFICIKLIYKKTVTLFSKIQTGKIHEVKNEAKKDLNLAQENVRPKEKKTNKTSLRDEEIWNGWREMNLGIYKIDQFMRNVAGFELDDTFIESLDSGK